MIDQIDSVFLLALALAPPRIFRAASEKLVGSVEIKRERQENQEG